MAKAHTDTAADRAFFDGVSAKEAVDELETTVNELGGDWQKAVDLLKAVFAFRGITLPSSTPTSLQLYTAALNAGMDWNLLLRRLACIHKTN